MAIKHVVNIQTEVEQPEVDETYLRVAALATLKHQSVTEPQEMSIVLTDDASMRALNRRFRGLDRTTDVLSFSESAAGGPFGGGGGEFPAYLGDIVISLPQAQRQAEEVRCTLTEELQLLIVHGTLHLLGYDHAESAEKAAMWAAQAELLSLLNISAPLPE